MLISLLARIHIYFQRLTDTKSSSESGCYNRAHNAGELPWYSTAKKRAHHLGLAPKLVPDVEGKEDGQVDIYRTLHQPMQYTQT